ncbi:ATP-grasp domain-containing protein [Paenibacillus sp. sgz500958]|uniref:ATP-grasp domain-containing protein n=1 Tax=Paenibacillus sp. sgz500958 TaxID=3242475 RepID=UPI0036D41690
MPDKLLFIESNTTGTGMLALEKAASWGLEALFFTNDPERYAGLAETGCEIIVCDTNNSHSLGELIRQRVKREDICGIVTTSDFYLETVAELTLTFDLPGNTKESIRIARHKDLTRRTLAEAGIHQPRFEVICSLQEVSQAVEKIGLPCILKPADDSASNDVILVTSVEQAKQHARRILGIGFNTRGQKREGVILAEEYIDAPEFSVEMFTWQGKTTCIGITQKSLACFPHFVESGHIFPAPIPEKAARQMKNVVGRALEAVGIQYGATHTELKWTPEGAAIIEINARLAGGMIPELIRLTTGVDVLEQQILCAMGRPTLEDSAAKGVAGIQFLLAEYEGILEGIEGAKAAEGLAFVKRLAITAKAGVRVQPARNAYHRLGYVIVHSPSYEETRASLQAAIDLLRIRITEYEIGGLYHD